MKKYVPTYCTPEEVAATLDLPDIHDSVEGLAFSDQSHPTYDQVCKMICSAEDEIDLRTRRTWRENYVENQQLSIQDYWGDINGWRSEFYIRGGHYIQLRKNVRPWNPNPVFSKSESEIHLEDIEGIEEGQVCTLGRHKGMVISIYPGVDSGYDVVYYRQIYSGDKLEIRSRNNEWLDISGYILDRAEDAPPGDSAVNHEATMCYIDYQYGKVYIRTRLYQNKENAIRISYRYGKDVEDLPAAINRAACLLTAIDIIVMQPFYIKVGASGDIGQARKEMLDRWEKKIGEIYSAYQRPGSVHKMW